MPLSALVVCVAEFGQLPVGHLHDGHFVPVHLDLSGFLSNVFLIQNVTHQESASAPLWTLPYEMQMYLVLPGLFLLVRAIGSLLPIVCLWLAGILAMLHASALARHGIPDFVECVPYFLPGIIAYKMMARSKFKFPAVLWPVLLAGITAFYLRDPSRIRGAICSLCLGIMIPFFEQLSQPALVRISQLIARYSYGIYLTHFASMWLAFQALDAWPRPGQWLVFVALLIGVPYILYHLIEEPMINYGRKVASKMTTGRDFGPHVERC